MSFIAYNFIGTVLTSGCSGSSDDTSQGVDPSSHDWATIESADERGAWLRAFSTSDTTWIIGGQPKIGAMLRGDPINGFDPFPLPENTPLLNWADGTTNNLWVGGLYGTILQWNGTEWIDHSQDVDEAIWGLVVQGDEVVAVGGTSRWGGTTGVIFHWNGSVWNNISPPTELSGVGNFFKVAYDGSQYWVVGASGSAFYGDIEGWTAVPTGITHDLITVISPEPNSVEIVGGRGTGIYLIGDTESLITQEPLIAGINGIANHDEQRLLVGELGYSVVHTDNGVLEIEATTSHILHAATATSDGKYWIAVGGNLATSEDTYEGSVLFMEIAQ